MRPSSLPLIACAALVVVMACVGSSRPSRFYTLAPLDVRGRPPSTAGVTLAVGPVEIPETIDRQEIVTRTGTNELSRAAFDRWGGSLDGEISRSLVATLGDRLASRDGVVSPWRAGTAPPGGTTYRAAVSISRFDGVLGQSVVLRGRWELIAETDRDGRSLSVREATVTEKIDGAGYGALVAAMQRALVRFGQEMADEVTATIQVASAR